MPNTTQRQLPHSSATAPDVSCIKCFHCGKQVSTYHNNLVFRATAVCPECTEKGEDTKAAAEQARKEERERIDAAIKELERLAAEEDQLKKKSKTNEPWMGHAYAASAYMKAIALLQAGRK